MSPHNNNPPENSVFYLRKQLDHCTEAECSVFITPLHEFGRVTYSFSLSLTVGERRETETVTDVTCDKVEAEKIFNLICMGNLHPCHLHDLISDSIGVI